eukprot:365030-Chlamydomonas_euryale.AAC.3
MSTAHACVGSVNTRGLYAPVCAREDAAHGRTLEEERGARACVHTCELMKVACASACMHEAAPGTDVCAAQRVCHVGIRGMWCGTCENLAYGRCGALERAPGPTPSRLATLWHVAWSSLPGKTDRAAQPRRVGIGAGQ